jgi:hypothetical protein
MLGQRTAFTLGALFALAACSAATPTITTPVTGPEATEPLATIPLQTQQPTPADTPASEPTGDMPLSDGYGWPVTANLTVSGTPLSDGSYSGTGPARFCGTALYTLDYNARRFNLELWQGMTGDQIRAATFVAVDLVPGSTATLFDIDVAVHTADGEDPAATHINAGQPGMGGSGEGTAQLTVDGATRTLQLHAVDNDGYTVELTAVCTSP